MKNKYQFKLKTEEINDSHMGLARRIKPGEHILELGCSSGYLSRFLKEDLGCYVVGVDIDSDSIAEAKAYCDKAIVADLDSLAWFAQIAQEKFDTILCADVLEHLKAPALLLRRLKAYLKPNGRILSSIPNVAHASVRLELLQGHFDYESLGILDDTHLHFYTLNGCVTLFMQAGYLCSDVAYSIHDLADEVIDNTLKNIGMTISETGRQRFHAPDATAFQYIIEAIPADESLLQEKPPILTPKPLVSSGAFYSLLVNERDELFQKNQRQEGMIHGLEETERVLRRELAEERIHNANHAKNIKALNELVNARELELKQERIHNQNHVQNIDALQKTLRARELELEQERTHNRNHLLNIKALQQTLNAREAELERINIQEQNHLIHIANHLKNIEALNASLALVQNQLANEKQHNLNHQAEIQNWRKTAREIDEGLFTLTLKNEALVADKHRLDVENCHLRDHFESELTNHRLHIDFQKAEIDRLEGVLQRVHNKLSYRAVRFIKNSPQIFTTSAKHSPSSTDVLASHEMNAAPPHAINPHDYALWLTQFNNQEQLLLQYREEAKTWQNPPKIAIIMPTYNPTQLCLEEAIQSVLAQVYDHWELCIADDASTEPWVKAILQRYADDSRIKIVYREKNGHISKASNSALELVDADYVALMDHDDVLTPDALYWVSKTIMANPDVALIYSDEDKLNLAGERYGPYFKTDWNPELLMSHNFICHLGVYKTDKIRAIGGFDPAYDGAQDYDLALRYVASIDDQQIIHIPRILYHWRATPGSTANGIHEKPYAEPLIRKAVERALQAKAVEADVSMHERLSGALRVRYKLPKKLPLVSIIIPTYNGFSLLKRCVDSILSKTDYANFEIIIIDNASNDWVALRYFEYLRADDRIRVIRDEQPFNYAAINNDAVKLAKGEMIALLNNDLEIITEGWLSEMVSLAQYPKVGAVGAKLYYPNDHIQHAGVIIGLGGVAGHSHKHFPRDNAGYCGRLLLTQNLSAVTAACLVVRKSVFEEVGGFDADNLKVAFNDVDLCLRIQAAGYRNVWTPYAELYHFESATRGYEDTPEKQARFTNEVNFMKQRWQTDLRNDPAYNPNLTLDREDFSFAFPPRV